MTQQAVPSAKDWEIPLKVCELWEGPHIRVPEEQLKMQTPRESSRGKEASPGLPRDKGSSHTGLQWPEAAKRLWGIRGALRPSVTRNGSFSATAALSF